MKVLLLLLLVVSCLAALALASPLPRPQGGGDPRLFVNPAFVQGFVNNVLGLADKNPLITTLLDGIDKEIICNTPNNQACVITIG